MAVETRSTTRAPGPWFRTLCGAITLGLSLVCVISSLPYLTTTSGSDQLTIWAFFLWGLGLAAGGAWLVRGRSKGQDIVLVLDRKRLLTVAAMTVVVVGMAVFFTTLPAEEGSTFDASLGYRTMFANLFATLPFMLFDQEDDQERAAPLPQDAAGRQRVTRRILLLVLAGVVAWPVGVLLGVLVHPWFEEILPRLAAGLLVAAAVLGYRLR
ncbi:hypothetical protein GMA12_09440 [Kocuria sediminis]|uniref:Uncharacterized protein n=1 Tax=Kocuria sediminis TaxID=1038857 RepID=A0A6N8GKC3_9MICC|nr:hypothetical protein [Kocuria sediminis]MUN63358.1 hypothetical protein [Kocuria sediminis]